MGEESRRRGPLDHRGRWLKGPVCQGGLGIPGAQGQDSSVSPNDSTLWGGMTDTTLQDLE